MKNKGFTLIELLAVIVILAIIALIATPIILGIINDARESAKTRSAELVATGVEYAITTYMYKNNGNAPTEINSEFATKYFKVENYEMDATGAVRQKGADANSKAFCQVTIANKQATVDCGSTYGDVKNYTTRTIALGTL